MSKISRASALGAASALLIMSPQLAARVVQAAPRADGGDVKLLNSSIALERAALKAYADAAATNLLTPTVLSVLKTFMADHQTHLDSLVTAVTQGGATPSPETAPIPTPAFATEADILAHAYTIERLAASTYLGTIAQFKNRDLAATAASIVGVDAAHVALLAEALKRNPAYPSGFVTA
ncbi:MAG: hypothetical protein NVSMB19_13150 [Vulcanimicrobiaceae bacterium]